MFQYGKSIGDILFDFEHSFLEVPPILLSLKRSPPAVGMICMRKNIFQDCFIILWGHNQDVHKKDLLDKRLAIAMMPHKDLSPDILSLISKLSEDSISEDSITEKPWPDFTETIEHDLRRFRQREIDERMDYEYMIRGSRQRGSSREHQGWS